MYELDEENYEEEEPGSEDCMIWRQLDVVRWMRHISKWEIHCHVHDPSTGKDFTLIHLNRKAYLENFERLIREKGDWKVASQIPELAKKEFQKVNQAFRERFKRIMALTPHPAFPKILTLDGDRWTKESYVEMEHVEGKGTSKNSEIFDRSDERS